MNEKKIQHIRKHKKVIHRTFYSRKEPNQKVKDFFNFSYQHEFNGMMLLSIEQPSELCRVLDTPFYELEEMINDPQYKEYEIDKKKKGKRHILAPNHQLKEVQKELNFLLQGYYLSIKSEESTGFVIQPSYLKSDCNIVENAKPHVGKRQVLNIDLKDFFPNISAKRVKELFISPVFNYNEQIANALTLLTTYKGKLPTGAPSSPVISNFICLQLDKELKEFCEKEGLTYTRYADDLTFSSDFKIPEDDMLDIINIISKNNFIVNFNKLRLKSAGRKQTVTGITVNTKINVDRKFVKKIRAMLHDLTVNGINAATQRHFKLTDIPEQEFRLKFLNRIKGYINFVGQVKGKNDKTYNKFKQDFNALFTSERIDLLRE